MASPKPKLWSLYLKHWKFFFVVLWPLVLLPLPVIGQSRKTNCAYAVAILAGYWMTEALPIAITSLMPMVLYPLLGVQSSDILAREYLKDSILIFVGGLLIANGFEFSGLHKRVALRVILLTGTSTKMLMMGIMLCTLFLSMWMSNTAVTAMMVPIISAVLEELEICLNEVYGEDGAQIIDAQCNGGHRNSIYTCNITLNPRLKSVEFYNTSYNNSLRGLRKLSLRDPDQMEMKPVNRVPVAPTVDTVEVNPDLSSEKKPEQTKVGHFLKKLRTMFMLSCCYASNIGGTGVITGSGTNLVAIEFLGNLDPKHHGDHAALNFTTWLAFNIVPMLINVAIAWIYLQVSFLGLPDWVAFWRKSNNKNESTNSKRVAITPAIEKKIKEMLQKTYKELGSMSAHERGVGVLFLFAVAMWIFHDPKVIPGWSELFPKKVSISTSALAVSVLFFMVPRDEDFYRAIRKRDFRNVTYRPLLTWEFIHTKFPWGVIILLGGGYAMSNGAKVSGLSEWIGQSLKTFGSLPPYALLAIICGLIAFLTEIASNTATATLVLPILLELSKELNIHPLYLTLPATVVCSYAFMLPVATPPNAIVYAASDMKVSDMVKRGFFMNCSCVFVLYLSTISYGNIIFRFTDYNYVP